MQTYFSNFPTITYNGISCIDITKSVKFDTQLLNNPYVMQTIPILQECRSDQLSNQIYNDPYMEWIVFLSNQIVNPYEWYLTQDQFYEYIQNKYGDYILAQQKVKFYINNWYNGINLTPGGFYALSDDLKEFYTPVYDSIGNVMQYTRIAVDWVVSTNHMLQFSFVNNIPQFIDDEIVYINLNANASVNGQVSFSGNNELVIQHLTGSYNFYQDINANGFSITGNQSGSIITISSNNDVDVNIYHDITPDQDVYFDPVSYFDYENNINEARRNLQVVQNTYTQQIISEIKSAF